MINLKRILVVRTDRLGDVILTLPMLPLLRERYPHAHLAMLLSTYTGDIVRGNRYVDEIIWYDDGGVLHPFNAMLEAIRAGRFDAVIVVHPTPRLAWLMFRAGIPLRIGTGYRYYSFLFNTRVFEHRKDAKKHELEYNLELLRPLSCNIPAYPVTPDFDIHVPPEAETRVRSLLKSLFADAPGDLVVLHPGSGGSARQWPIESFGRLATKLASESGAQICVTGLQKDSHAAEQVVQRTQGRAHSVAGQLSVKELAALLKLASLVVANSTGPLHLAVAVGTPVVGLYPQSTPMSAKRWGPYTTLQRVFVPRKPLACRDCEGGRTPECACMASIEVEDVHQGCLSLLGEARRMKQQEIAHAS